LDHNRLHINENNNFAPRSRERQCLCSAGLKASRLASTSWANQLQPFGYQAAAVPAQSSYVAAAVWLLQWQAGIRQPDYCTAAVGWTGSSPEQPKAGQPNTVSIMHDNSFALQPKIGLFFFYKKTVATTIP